MSHLLVAMTLADKIAERSDLTPEVRGDTIYIRGCRAVQSEVIQQFAVLALANGVRQYMVTTLPQGGIRFEIMSHSENLCWICTGEGYKLHDDGVCYLCRDPNVEPDEQQYQPQHIAHLRR